MSQPGFETEIAVKKRPQTHAFDRMATGTGVLLTLTIAMLFGKKAFLEVQKAIVCPAKKMCEVKAFFFCSLF